MDAVDFLSGVANTTKNVQSAVDNAYNIRTGLDIYKSYTSTDEKEKKYYSDRTACHKRFFIKKIKLVFKCLILPIILLICNFYLGKLFPSIINITFYITCGLLAWIGIGSIITAVNSFKWTYQNAKLLASSELSEEKCTEIIG